MNTQVTDVAVVGAGPYGMSVSSHLRHAGLSTRTVGKPMEAWQTAMPRGMFLKSQGFATNIADPGGTRTLREFCRSTGRDYADYGLPVPLDTFTEYGQWFQRSQVPFLEEILVTRLSGGVAAGGGQFHLELSDGRGCRARNVVVAVGLDYCAYVPDSLATLSPLLWSHSSACAEPAEFSGREVVVVGAGQSALEDAALMAEAGARVTVLSRSPNLVWNDVPLDPDRPLYDRLREPEAGLGSGWATWFYSNRPELFRRLPPSRRVKIARTALGPAGAHWLRPRIEGRVTVLLGYEVVAAESVAGRARLYARSQTGSRVLDCDHVVAATGYRCDVAGMPFLSPSVRARLRTLAGTPRVDRGFESSIRGLYFVGPAVAPSFGPLMRFVHGTGFTARTLTSRLAGPRASGSHLLPQPNLRPNPQSQSQSPSSPSWAPATHEATR